MIKRNEANVNPFYYRADIVAPIFVSGTLATSPRITFIFFQRIQSLSSPICLLDLRLTGHTIFWIEDATLCSGINVARCPTLLPVAGNIAK